MLALYFLSVPFGQAWERVRRIADEQGGFPAGATPALSATGSTIGCCMRTATASGRKEARTPANCSACRKASCTTCSQVWPDVAYSIDSANITSTDLPVTQ